VRVTVRVRVRVRVRAGVRARARVRVRVVVGLLISTESRSCIQRWPLLKVSLRLVQSYSLMIRSMPSRSRVAPTTFSGKLKARRTAGGAPAAAGAPSARLTCTTRRPSCLVSVRVRVRVRVRIRVRVGVGVRVRVRVSPDPEPPLRACAA